ncbi:hypothetical protein CRUP_023442 [Coryphaenoides rupestris]|nr:hypothetical protein CRUP_023442 [Coryphaenoides rupestris]
MEEGEAGPGPGAEHGEGADPKVFAADSYAAESMAADLDPWIVFDARRTPRAEFDDWLESNRPSCVSRYGDEDGESPVGWIAVMGPDHSPSSPDVLGLQESWEQLLASGRPVTFQTVKELALNHNVLSGKWLMHLDTGYKLEHAWECLARAVLDGKLSMAKVSTHDPRSDSGRQVICVYNNNFTDEGEVMQLDGAIRSTGVKCMLVYKPDVYTYLGIYRHNRWKICPTIYESRFNLECVPRRSLVMNKITKTEVT